MNINNFIQEGNTSISHYRYVHFIKTRPIRDLILEEGYELHHIIPKALGGKNEDSNMIKLTCREHYIAHLILWKCGYQKMAYAFWRMNNNNKDYGCRLNSRQYEQLRLDRSKILSEGQMGELNHRYGKHHSEEWKRKVSEKLKGKLHSPESYKRAGEKQKGEKNHRYGKHPSQETIEKIVAKTRGQKRTEEQKQHLREGAKNRDKSYLQTESWRSKQSEAHKRYLETYGNPFSGKTHSEESKKKISDKKSKLIICLQTGEIFKSLELTAEHFYGDAKYYGRVWRSIKKGTIVGGFSFHYYTKKEEQDSPVPPVESYPEASSSWEL